jgi:hypothetical protein
LNTGDVGRARQLSALCAGRCQRLRANEIDLLADAVDMEDDERPVRERWWSTSALSSSLLGQSERNVRRAVESSVDALDEFFG